MAINNILAFRNDRFGEFLLTIPAFWMLRQNYPEAKITLVVDENVRQLAQRLSFIDKLIIWENRKHRLGEILKFRQEHKRGHYDLAVIFNPSQEFNMISFIAGIPLRAGYDRKWGFLLNRKIADNKEQGLKHEVDYNLELLKVIGIEIKRADIQFPIDIKDRDFPDSRMVDLGIENKRFIAIHPWSSNPAKELKEDKFKDVCERLSRKIPYGFGYGKPNHSLLAYGCGNRKPHHCPLAYKLVLIGGQEETKRSGAFCEGLPVIDLTGKTTLLELSGLLKRSRLLVTVDSGPMHLAAVLGTLVVAIFRKKPPAVSAKRWGPVGKNHLIIENDNLANIEADEVINAVRKALSR